MPLLGQLIQGLVFWLGGFLAKFMTEKVAVGVASFLAYMAMVTAFTASVHVCLASLQGLVQSSSGGGGSLVRFFFMGVGMFIPSNAGAILSCIGSVWVGTTVFVMRKNGFLHFGSRG